jgi:hypothetical protein
MFWPLIAGFVIVIVITLLIGWAVDARRRGAEPPRH